MDAVQLRELLARKRRPEVRIALADDAKHLHPQCRRIGPVARLPAAARHQCSRAVLPKYLAQPKHLATAKPHQRHCLRNPDPLLCQIAQNVHPIDLRTAHQNHRHRPPAPHPIRKPGRVTSLSGPTVTSLSGAYSARIARPVALLGLHSLSGAALWGNCGERTGSSRNGHENGCLCGPTTNMMSMVSAMR